jgi:hypothetical protein
MLIFGVKMSTGRPIGAKNLTLREDRFKAEIAKLKADNSALKAQIVVEKIKTKEAKAVITQLRKQKGQN